MLGGRATTGAEVIKVMCLMPLTPVEGAPGIFTEGGVPGIFLIDPEYNGETGDAWKDHALCKLIFDASKVTGEVWREVQGGHEGQRAWRVAKA